MSTSITKQNRKSPFAYQLLAMCANTGQDCLLPETDKN
jgi:hypothetical protein